MRRALDPGLWDAPAVVEALRRFATHRAGAQVQLLLQDAGTPQRALAPLIGLGQREVCLDFRPVEFVGSSTLGMIVRLRERLLQADRRLYLCPLPPRLAEAFEVAHMNGLFDVCPSEQDAGCPPCEAPLEIPTDS